ncbi:hypothetical protein A6A08_06945 [Nocardiopsis sp. TSRI0078]|nr:hypothetical protein A6A08_06945 [Nocardiopsis sp. TSRI0078]
MDLVRATLVTLVAHRLSAGEGLTKVTEWLTVREVFSSAAPTTEILESLVHRITERLEQQRLWLGSALEMTGIPQWNLEELSSCLTEYWASQRGSVVPAAQLRHELTGCWDIRMPELIDAWMGLPEDPFADFVDAFGILKQEETIVGNLASLCLSHGTARSHVEAWVDSLHWDINHTEHLFLFGTELRYLRAARQVLNNSMARADMPPHVLTAGRRVNDLWDELETRYRSVMRGLTAFEVLLLVDRDDDEVFADECLAVYMAQHRPNIRKIPCETAAGTWGPVPWLVVVVRGEEQVAAARKILGWEVHQITANIPQSFSSPVGLSLDAPPLESAGVDAAFSFFPRRVGDLCQILLIAKRREVSVEFVELRWNEDLEAEESIPIGARGFLFTQDDAELLDRITSWACSRLRRLLPNGPLAEDEYLANAWASRGPLVELLSQPEDLDPWG